MRKIILLLLLIAILVSGCEGNIKNSIFDFSNRINDALIGKWDKEDEGPVFEYYYGGEKGLSFEVSRPMEGTTYYSDAVEKVRFIIELLNEGEADINQGEICLQSKLPKEYFDDFDGCNCQGVSMGGKNKELGMKEGEHGELEFFLRPIFPDFENSDSDYSLSEDYVREKVFDFDVIAQYEYWTSATLKACVERYDPYGGRGCNYGEGGLFGKGVLDESSSAPVQIKKVTQQDSGGINKILLNIEVVNKGNGRVINSLAECSPTDVGKVELFINNAPGRINCKSDEIILDKNGEGSVRCLIEDVEGEGRVVDFGIELYYIYEEREDASFTLKESKS